MIVKELIQKRTKNTKTYLRLDGSYETHIYKRDVHFEDDSGNLYNIETKLFDESDFDLIEDAVSKEKVVDFKERKDKVRAKKNKNSLNRDLMEYHSLKTPFDCIIPRNFKRGYSISKGSDKLTFKPVGASPSKGQPCVDKDNAIEYQDPWNDVDVCLELTDVGIKETLIVKTNLAPSTFSFEVTGELTDELTAGVLKLEPAWLKDAVGTIRDVIQTVRRVGNKVYLDLIADLTDLIYPVEIDPTVILQPDGTAGKDATIYSGSPTVNGGTIQYIYPYVGNDNLLQFDLSSIPAGSTIINSNLYLTGISEVDSNNSTFNFYKITSTWVESTVTYNTRPTYNATPILTVNNGRSLAGIEYVFNLASVTQDWVTNGGNNGLYITGSGATQKVFASSDHSTTSYRPKLIVAYTQPPTAPTVTTPNGGETWNASHTITWNPASDASTTPVIAQTMSLASASSTGGVSGGTRVGMTFTITNPLPITKIRIKTTDAGATRTLAIRHNGTNAPYNGSIVAQASVTADGTGLFTWNLVTPIAFTVGQVIAVEFQSGVNYQYGQEDVYSGGNSYYFLNAAYNGMTWDAWLELTHDDFTAQNNLKYQIQISTDNGGAWSDIIALTASGATSYPYDFTPVAQTAVAKIRIRAYDGYGYGPWDESNGVFTIQHNQAPTAPTLLYPSSGSIDRAQVIRLTWQHNDPNSGDMQSKFDLQWRQQGAGTWNTVTQTTVNQYYDVPANTFTKGNIEWQVRTYDQANVAGSYSAQSTFYAGDKPPSPTITAPTDGSVVAIAIPTIQWSSPDQVSYQLQILNADNSVASDSNEVVSTNKALTCLINLSNLNSYSIKLRIKNSDGIWSDWVSSNISVSFTPPPKPTVVLIPQNGYIEININNPNPSGTEPNVRSNDIFRKKPNETTWIRIASGLIVNEVYRDYSVASGITYDYKVTAYAYNGTVNESNVYQTSVTLRWLWLHDVSDPQGTSLQLPCRLEKSQNKQYEAVTRRFAGRKGLTVEFGESEDFGYKVKLQLIDKWSLLEALADRKSTICVRDARGRKIYGYIPRLPETDQLYGQEVDLEIIALDYSESVDYSSYNPKLNWFTIETNNLTWAEIESLGLSWDDTEIYDLM